jgi:hypothetical protein
MKKLIAVLTLTLFTLSSNFAYSIDAEPEKMKADAGYVMGLLMLCKDYAQDEQVAQAAMNSFLLTCINDELEEADYKFITVLPKEEDED